MCITTADWIQIGIGGATLLAVMVALFQTRIARRWNRTAFAVSVLPRMPHCVMTPALTTSGSLSRALVVRAEVRNVGETAAGRVEVFLQKLERKNTSDKWVEVETFVPDTLKWSGVGTEERSQLLPGDARYVDVFQVVRPSDRSATLREQGQQTPTGHGQQTRPLPPIATFYVVSPNFAETHIVETGKYRVSISVSAENANASYTFEFELRNEWSDNFDECLQKCVLIPPGP